MANPLFNALAGGNNNGIPQIIQQFQKFKQQFNGNPQQYIQGMLNSGKITQEQYNNAVQMANQLQKMMG